MRKEHRKGRICRITEKALRVLKKIQQYGPAYAWLRIKMVGSDTRRNNEWMRMHSYTSGELNKQRQEGCIPGITFSIIVPLYNTPETFLHEMIDSVRRQTYSGWELCLGDGSDNQHDQVGKFCIQCAQQDPRIRYRKLERNLGISGNSNACLELATGQFIVLMDHDDILHEAALYEVAKEIAIQEPDVIYTDEAVVESQGRSRIHSFFYKQDFGIDHLRSNNYFCHLTVFRRSLLEITGGFRSEYDGSQDHDLMLRIISITNRVVHIPKVLYFWRASESSSANNDHAKTYAYTAGAKAVTEHLRVSGIPGYAYPDQPGVSRIVYEIRGEPLISILITWKGSYETIEQCIRLIEEKSTYKNIEILVVEPVIGAEKADLSGTREQKASHGQILAQWPQVRFFESEPGTDGYLMKNQAANQAATGDYFLFLDGETQVISPRWIEEMLMYAQREDVGAVGAMLYYQDDTVRHAGYLLGENDCVGSYCYRHGREEGSYYSRLRYAQDLSAVSDACMMIRRDVWDRFGGFDPAYGVSLGDADLCLRIRKKGKLVVWTPWAELYCGDAPGRGENPSGKQDFSGPDIALFRDRWEKQIQEGDPYYNPNLSLDTGNYDLDWESLFQSRKKQRQKGESGS